MDTAHRRVSTIGYLGDTGTLSDKRLTKLPEHWDHIYLPLIEVVWARIFLGIPLYIHLIFGGPSSPGILLLGYDSLKRRLGWTKAASLARKPEHVFADLFLETTCAIFCDATEITETEDGNAFCRFSVPNAASLGPDGRVTLDVFEGVIDCKRREGVSCSFGGKSIPFADGVVLLFLILVGQVHTQVHAYANWGTNVSASHPFVRRMSVCTVMYNYYGSKGFPTICKLLSSLGCFTMCTREIAQAVLGRTYIQSTPSHRHIKKLQPYSSYVDFIVKVRSFFMMEFAKHQLDFPGVDGESLFLGTVLHSTDHGNATHYVKITDLYCEDASFAPNLEMTRLVCANFIDRQALSSVFYGMQFKHGRHPLYRKTYEYAATVDKRLADEMECAIVR